MCQMYCDNIAVVQARRPGKSRDPHLAACVRNVRLWTAKFDTDLTYAQHISKKQK